MKKLPSDDVTKVIWGIQALAAKNIEELSNAERVLNNLLADDLQEENESIEDLRNALKDYVQDAVWIGEGESIARRVEQTLEKIGSAAKHFNWAKERAGANS